MAKLHLPTLREAHIQPHPVRRFSQSRPCDEHCCSGHRNSHHLWNGKQECRISLSLVSDGMFTLRLSSRLSSMPTVPSSSNSVDVPLRMPERSFRGRLEWIPITLSLLSSDSARCSQCGGYLAQKSELRAHQMARKLRSSGLTPQKSELSSHQVAPARVVAHSSSWTPAAYECREVLPLRLFGLRQCARCFSSNTHPSRPLMLSDSYLIAPANLRSLHAW